jgi:hypothetical protein
MAPYKMTKTPFILFCYYSRKIELEVGSCVTLSFLGVLDEPIQLIPITGVATIPAH